VPSDEASFAALQDAGKVLGWSVKEITFNSTVEDLNAKFEQAISEKPTAIMLAGVPVAAMQKPLADAKRAGIVVALGGLPDVATSYPGFAASSDGSPAFTLTGEINAYEFMRASNCKGSAEIVALANFPIFTAAVDAFKSTIASKCPACKASVVTLKPTELGTPAATSAIVSGLQSNPSIKYIYGTLADVITGVSTAISQAGISGITVFGTLPDQPQIAALQSGDKTWWVSAGNPMSSWVKVDSALLAIATHQPVNLTGFPTVVYTPENIGSGKTAPVDPPNYQQLFAQLWHISS
jgi:ABC-type sugar transport system substrate-binding protein